MAAFALLFVVFAHRPPMERALDPVTAIDYVLPDGTIADICFGMNGVSEHDHSGSHQDQAPFCDFCRLASSVFLPVPPQESFLLGTYVEIGKGGVFEPVIIDDPLPRPRSRAPPSVV